LKSHEHADLVKLAALYSSIVSLKIAIVVNLKKAYAGNCRSKLKKQFKAIPTLQKKIAKFHSLYKKLWLKERKPFGLEVMDSRFATMEARAKTLKESIKNYLTCRQDSIPKFELEFPQGLTAYDLSSFRKLSTRCLSLW